MELQNYFYVATNGRVIEFGEEPEYLVRGKVYGRGDSVEGDFISTSRIEEHHGKYVITETGSRYDLINAHPDYLELLDVRRKDFPIITNWRFRVDHLTTEASKEKPGESLEEMFDRVIKIKRYSALIINGRTLDGEVVDGEIVAQNGNYVTLKVWRINSDGILGLVDQQYFINWFNPDPMFGAELLFYPHRFGVRYDDKLKPRIDFTVYLEYRQIALKEAMKKTTD